MTPFYPNIPNDVLKSKLISCERAETIALFLKLAKNAGFIFKGETILDLDLKCKEELADIVSGNSIYSKQVELARKQIARNTTIENGKMRFQEIPPRRQLAVIEIMPEATFNKLVMLEARDVCWKAKQG